MRSDKHSGLLCLCVPALVVLLSSTAWRGVASVAPVEQEALLLFKHYFKDQYKYLKTWVKGSDCSLWYGVTCNAQGRVTKIDVNDQSLGGKLSPLISYFVYLEYLDLSYNRMSGGLPSEIGSVKKLKTLKIDQSSLSGGIPSTIGNLTELQTLSLNGNQLSGPIPSAFLKLKNLKSINLNGNYLSGTPPIKCSSYSSCDLDSNCLKGVSKQRPASECAKV